MRKSLVYAAVVHGLGASAVASSPPSVTIGAGTLQGGICSTTSNVAYFKSIPYAQPPTGALRFMPPVPLTQNYSDVLQATAAAPACIQFGAVFAETGPTSEDCLYLDIWTPANATAASALPVRVWIYGGANSAGGISDPLYDGCNVAAANALLVSINYRVGPLGFLALNSAGIGGNQAIQDILLGLEWVQRNIAAFGGDPKKVLLHGQSAGGTDTFTVATLPQAPGLISAAIMESGGGRDAFVNDSIQILGQSYAQSLNCSVSNATCLRTRSVADLKTTYTNLPLLHLAPLGAVRIDNVTSYDFGPHVDGKIIPTQPSQQGVRVPSIFGSNAREGTLFALAQYASVGELASAATAKDYETFLYENFGSAAPLIEQYYPLSAFSSSPYPAFFAIAQVLTDAEYFCSAYRGLNTAVANGVPTWTYFFSHSPNCTWLPSIPQEAVPLLGPTHTAEIPFVFGNTVNLPGPNGTCDMTEQEQAISAFLVEAWTSMADIQRPTSDETQWPAYGNAQKSLGINITNVTTTGYVDYTVCKLWDGIHEKLIATAGNETGSNSTGAPGNASSTGAAGPSTSPTASAGGASGLGSSLVGVVVLGVGLVLHLIL